MSEKVDGGNGKFYTRDHPHEIISPHVMRFSEIREWIKELRQPKYGWTLNGLDRALGLTAGGGRRILRAGWIWPKQQMRLTIRIRQILAGYVVPTRFANGRVDGVYTDPPQPPRIAKTPTLKMQATRRGVRFMAQDYRPPPKLPSFRRAFAEALPWSPKK